MVEKIAAFIGLAMVAAFVLGLAESISSGFAGFWGGLPFWCIVVPILSLIVYDFWDACFRSKKGFTRITKANINLEEE